jgi:protein TonB
MLNRYISAAVFALCVTASLFYVMSTLIATGEKKLNRDADGRIVDFIRVKQDETIQTKSRKVDKPEKPKAPPPALPNPKIDLKTNTKFDSRFTFNPNVNIQANRMAAGEGDYLPIVKVLPIYPNRAASRGIEGYVVVEFMVTKFGTTQDIKVVEAKPPGYFERAAIKAARKFKYKPKVINGEPVDVAGVQNLITFKLEK